MSIGRHQSARSKTTTWITPPNIIAALGGPESFDLDPAAAPDMPWPTARRMLTERENGLSIAWFGRVWLNPPYTTSMIEAFMARMADHRHGIALVFARTETQWAEQSVFGAASGILFLHGRLHFHYPDGTRAAANAGAPSMLVAYGLDDLDRLRAADLHGALVPLTPIAGVYLLNGLQQRDPTWRQLIRDALRAMGGQAGLEEVYRRLEGHPKCAANRNWKPKIRQVINRVADRVGEAMYALDGACQVESAI